LAKFRSTSATTPCWTSFPQWRWSQMSTAKTETVGNVKRKRRWVPIN